MRDVKDRAFTLRMPIEVDDYLRVIDHRAARNPKMWQSRAGEFPPKAPGVASLISGVLLRMSLLPQQEQDRMFTALIEERPLPDLSQKAGVIESGPGGHGIAQQIRAREASVGENPKRRKGSA